MCTLMNSRSAPSPSLLPAGVVSRIVSVSSAAFLIWVCCEWKQHKHVRQAKMLISPMGKHRGEVFTTKFITGAEGTTELPFPTNVLYWCWASSSKMVGSSKISSAYAGLHTSTRVLARNHVRQLLNAIGQCSRSLARFLALACSKASAHCMTYLL